MTAPAISADHLARSFGSTHALVDVSLAVPAGSVCALLGRNGAGKTTTVRILTTLLDADSGQAEVAGFDVATQANEVRGKIGVTGQTATMDELLTGAENLETIGRFCHLGAAASRRRAETLLEQFDLVDARRQLVKRYSGGMRRRLDLAASLIHEPEVLFLDEPTTGLDPVGRGEMWTSIRTLVTGGTTVLLTTQYLDEADRLADSIVVMDRGLVVARGTPEQLKASIGRPFVKSHARHCGCGHLEAGQRSPRRGGGGQWTVGERPSSRRSDEPRRRRGAAPPDGRSRPRGRPGVSEPRRGLQHRHRPLGRHETPGGGCGGEA